MLTRRDAPSPALASAPQEREARIEEIGREILARAERSSTVFGSRWWERRLFRWTLAHPELRAGLFRFVDVLPSLASRREIASHLRRHLLEAHDLPRALETALRWSVPGSRLGDVAARTSRLVVRRIARRFIAGETLEQAARALARLRERGADAVLDVLGEVVTSETAADRYTRSVLDLIDGIPRVHVSLKLTSLHPRFDAIAPRRALATAGRRLRAILRRAGERGAHVTVDMEHHDVKEASLDLFTALLAEDDLRARADVGIVLQAYLRETSDDLDRVLDWVRRRGAPVLVRLVKGAYWDFETTLAVQRGWPPPVFLRKWETDAAFETLAERLLESHRLVRPAIASHNVRSLASALAAAEAIGLPTHAFEMQMLFGMADPIVDALVERGLDVRVYTPYGPLLPGMAYLMRRLLENTSNESFLRHSFAERAPLDELLANPAVARPPSPAPARPRSFDPEEEGAMETTPFRNEPTSDFGRLETRAAFRGALEHVRDRSCGADHPLWLGDRRAETGAWIESRSPSHLDLLVGRAARAGLAEADEAVDRARAAWPAWRARPAGERAAFLRRVAAELRRRRFELAAWIVHEVGKDWRGADAEVSEAIDFLELYAGEAERLMARPAERRLPGEENELRFEPRGVAAVIAPWNFPLAILTGMTAGALVTGNTAVVKPAEQSPVVAAVFFDCLQAAGLPPGVASHLPGIGEEVGAHLVAHPDVATIVFTGSRAVGLAMLAEAARVRPGQRVIKRVVAEMGGKNAIVVDEDADLDEAVRGIVDSAFGYAGQKCSACSRVIPLEGVHDALVERLVEATRSLRVGPAEDPASDVGPVIDEEARARILAAVESGRAAGRLVCRVEVDRPEGTYVGPVIFDRVERGSPLARDEIFGPVLSVLAARDFDEALEIANETDYALTGGLYSRDPAHVARAREELEVGNLYVNRGITGAIVDRQPFGGGKLSGVGAKAGGADYLRQFCERRTITENTLRHGFVPEELR